MGYKDEQALKENTSKLELVFTIAVPLSRRKLCGKELSYKLTAFVII
jgi:hypothetical protein